MDNYAFEMILPDHLKNRNGLGSRMRDDAAAWCDEHFGDWLTAASLSSGSPQTGYPITLYVHDEVMLVAFKLRWFNTEEELE